MATDNQGNTICILNEKTKKWPSSALVMQMVTDAHKWHVDLAINHTYRDANEWADQLAKGDSTGFDPSKRLTTKQLASDWELLTALTTPEIVKAQSKARKRKEESTAKLLKKPSH